MCGIGGIILRKGRTFGEEDVESVKILSEVLEARGTDAYGFITILPDGRVGKLFKIGAPASHVWEEFGDVLAKWIVGAKAVLVHTRAATTGSAKKNKNNHPFRIGVWYLAHNGFAGRMISSSSSSYGYKARITSDNDTEPETDSYRYLFKPLVEVLNNWWAIRLSASEIIEALNTIWTKYYVHGSIWLYNEDVKKLWIFRGEKELEYKETDKFIAFASKGLIVEEAEELKANTLITVDIKKDKVRRDTDLGIATEYRTVNSSYVVYGTDNYDESKKKSNSKDDRVRQAIDLLESIGYTVRRGEDGRWYIKDEIHGIVDWTYDIIWYIRNVFGVYL